LKFPDFRKIVLVNGLDSDEGGFEDGTGWLPLPLAGG
jgi:hypothetical protein